MVLKLATQFSAAINLLLVVKGVEINFRVVIDLGRLIGGPTRRVS